MWRLRRGPLLRFFGRHGLLLLFFGIIWLTYGYSVLNYGGMERRRFTSAMDPVWFGHIVESPSMGWLWIGGAVMAWLSAFFSRRRQPSVFGFTGLLVPPLAWVTFYAWSFVAALTTAGEYGNHRSWTGVCVWSSALVTILMITGWPDPDRPKKTPARHRGA